MTILNPAYAFLQTDYSNPNLGGKPALVDGSNEKDAITVPKILSAALPAALLTTPNVVFAASSDGTFYRVWNSVMNGFEWGVVLVIVFAGASWALGHRSKAIEYLIGACCGFILARHAIDIKDFLKTI